MKRMKRALLEVLALHRRALFTTFLRSRRVLHSQRFAFTYVGVSYCSRLYPFRTALYRNAYVTLIPSAVSPKRG